MRMILERYLKLSKNSDFLLLMIVIFVGQMATAFLILSLIVSVFLQTKSNFGISGIVLSVTVPGLALMALAGLFADIFDRRKVIILANWAIALVVLLILISLKIVAFSIPLSFLYFACNTFFLPAAQAASGQVVKKRELMLANSLFVFVFSGGILLGFFAAAIVHFFFGNFPTLVICEIFLIIAAVFSMFLPPLSPRRSKKYSLVSTILDIYKTFGYIFLKKSVWFSFVIFTLMQAILVFGVTLAPGFFDEVVGIGIQKSPIFIFPLIGIGVALGTFFVQLPKISESKYSAIGTGLMGASCLALGLFIRLGQIEGLMLLLPVAAFLVVLGFGEIVAIAASRTGLQAKVLHHYQGTVFSSSIIASSFLGSTVSPLAALFQVLFGYVNILIFGGLVILAISLMIVLVGIKWRL